MSSQYAGAELFPDDFTIPDDGEELTAAAFNVAYEALGDRTQWLKSRVVTISLGTALSSATVTAPARAFAVILEGCGGGGGGGAGAPNPGADSHASGAGGGGGAIARTVVIGVTGGAEYSYVIGAGGVSGTYEDDAPFPGGVGGDTTFSSVVGPTVLATFRGAGGGDAGTADDGLGPNAMSYGLPGAPVRIGTDAAGSGWPTLAPTEEKNLFMAPSCPQAGGAGTTSNNDRLNPRAGSSPQGYKGGAQGNADTSADGSCHGGGGGGGGGAGPYGDGANGGAGGAPESGGDGGDGTTGSSAAANTGAGGGGGGGSGGGAPAGAGVGGDGGAGGSGRLKITWLCAGT